VRHYLLHPLLPGGGLQFSKDGFHRDKKSKNIFFGQLAGLMTFLTGKKPAFYA
jgi:hypothetical protein